jgi:hypothetical protein
LPQIITQYSLTKRKEMNNLNLATYGVEEMSTAECGRCFGGFVWRTVTFSYKTYAEVQNAMSAFKRAPCYFRNLVMNSYTSSGCGGIRTYTLTMQALC